jgi:CBS domain-containing protein
MIVTNYMITDVLTCSEDDTVLGAVERMAEKDIGSLIVVKGDNPVGIFTERDLVKRVVAQGKDPNAITVGEVMSRELITVSAEERVGAAYHKLIRGNVRHAPVLKDGRLVGIVSQKDLGKVLDQLFFDMYSGKYGQPDLSGKY